MELSQKFKELVGKPSTHLHSEKYLIPSYPNYSYFANSENMEVFFFLSKPFETLSTGF